MVTKANGTKEAFSKWKVVRTCLRMGASQETAEAIADEIEAKLYNGIRTRRILQMIYSRLKKHKPVMKLQIEQSKGLSAFSSRKTPLALGWKARESFYDEGLRFTSL